MMRIYRPPLFDRVLTSFACWYLALFCIGLAGFPATWLSKASSITIRSVSTSIVIAVPLLMLSGLLGYLGIRNLRDQWYMKLEDGVLCIRGYFSEEHVPIHQITSVEEVIYDDEDGRPYVFGYVGKDSGGKKLFSVGYRGSEFKEFVDALRAEIGGLAAERNPT